MTFKEIKAHPKVLELYRQRLPLKKKGDEYWCLCPFHDDHSPSFSVFSGDAGWSWKCFSCAVKGTIIDFYMKLDGSNFKDAAKKVMDDLGINDDWNESGAQVDSTFHGVHEELEGEKKYITYSLEQWAAFERGLAASTEAQEFLAKRGLALETAKRLRLGFRKDISQFHKGDEDVAKGWIAFPCFDGDTVKCIKYRSIVSKKFARQPGMETVLFNINTITPLEPLYVTEGEFDAISLEQAGFRAVSLPNAATKVNPEMRDQLLKAGAVFLAGDSDQAGADAMNRLWLDIQERTYLFKWPESMKDANQTLLEKAAGNVAAFHELVDQLTIAAMSRLMPGVYSLQESMISSDRTNLADHPGRLRFPWPSVDNMFNLLPGGVLSLFATNTGMGKTTWAMNVLVEAARRGDVILNYSAELSTEEYANLVAAYLLNHDRNELTHEDYIKAAKMLVLQSDPAIPARFYIGRNPDLTTAGKVLDLIEAGVRRVGATVVVLDHLHYVCRNEYDTIKAQENAFQRIKNMAVKYGLKFICVGQPRKASQDRKGKAVHITDAKGSESFGSDADVVIALHRDNVKGIDPANPPKEPYSPVTQVHLQKGRSQGTGAAYTELVFNGSRARFGEKYDEQNNYIMNPQLS